ncbi:MAG: Mitochondrial mRNA-processing protein C-terminal [Pseudonocardiales bacterium]|nr:Mitochondrial mRNA-processing protein C-terminal [Pseudonocardiales bacterium]
MTRVFTRINRASEVRLMGSVIKKRRKRMAKKKHRKLLKKTRVQRRNKK